MRNFLKIASLSLRLISTDPVNIALTLIPTLITLGIYFICIFLMINNLDTLTFFLKTFISSQDQATYISKILLVVFIVLFFFIISWTFVIIVGIIAAPFNSLISSRIEQKLFQKKMIMDNRKSAIARVRDSFFRTLLTEIKKIGLLLVGGVMAFLLNLIPFLAPISLLLISLLIAAQFIDFSWSRHNWPVHRCLHDLMKNLIPYSFSGLLFLALASVPLLNALVPAFATSYFTILWLYKQGKINIPQNL